MTATFHVGDAIEVMSKLPEKSVDLILTSPPFLALRSYLPADHPDKALEGGSQATPGEYIDWLVDVVEACARVLAPHGSMCIELGDTYAGSGGAGGDWVDGGARLKTSVGVNGEIRQQPQQPPPFGGSASGMRRAARQDYGPGHGGGAADHLDNSIPTKGPGWPLAKSLSLIPELFRLTLVYGTNPLTGRTTERWRLRNVVRWVRPNPPVGALGDKFRPATSELMVFCKSAKRYFDLDSVRTEAQPQSPRFSQRVYEVDGHARQVQNPLNENGERIISNPAGAPPLDWWKIPADETVTLRRPCEHGKYDEHRNDIRSPSEGFAVNWNLTCPGGEFLLPQSAQAPPLDWWNIPPGGYEGAHYAVFPPELCVKPIKAMCPEKVCRVCGEPSRRIVETEGYRDKNGVISGAFKWESGVGKGKGAHTEKLDGSRTAVVNTLGWSDCGHDDWRPGVVLDPFGGSGTSALVATGHGRDAILIDLDERNYQLALDRVGPFILSRAS